MENRLARNSVYVLRSSDCGVSVIEQVFVARVDNGNIRNRGVRYPSVVIDTQIKKQPPPSRRELFNKSVSQSMEISISFCEIFFVFITEPAYEFFLFFFAEAV